MKNNIYVYLIDKKTENPQALYEEKKSKYFNVSRELIESLDEYVLSSGKRNKDERILVAALVLESVFDLVSFASFPIPRGIKKDAFGKPSFGGSDVKISIAHNEDYAVVAYAKGAEIGVDIEGEIDEKKAENLAVRFPVTSSLNVEKKENENGDEEKIIFLHFKEDSPFEPLNLPSADGSFSAKWTAAEAIMKCDGRGFSALGDIQNLLENMNISAFTIRKNNKKSYISLAMKK